MFKLILAVIIAASFIGCSTTKTYPVSYITVLDTTRNDNGIKNPITIHFTYPSSSQALILFSNGEMAYNNSGSFSTSDSLIVADSSYLFARWGYNHADTIATKNMTWIIH